MQTGLGGGEGEEQQSVRLCERDSEALTTRLTHITGQQSLRYVFLHSFHLTASKKVFILSNI